MLATALATNTTRRVLLALFCLTAATIMDAIPWSSVRLNQNAFGVAALLGLGSFTKSLWLIYEEIFKKPPTYSYIDFVPGHDVINFHV